MKMFSKLSVALMTLTAVFAVALISWSGTVQAGDSCSPNVVTTSGWTCDKLCAAAKTTDGLSTFNMKQEYLQFCAPANPVQEAPPPPAPKESDTCEGLKGMMQKAMDAKDAAAYGDAKAKFIADGCDQPVNANPPTPLALPTACEDLRMRMKDYMDAKDTVSYGQAKAKYADMGCDKSESPPEPAPSVDQPQNKYIGETEKNVTGMPMMQRCALVKQKLAGMDASTSEYMNMRKEYESFCNQAGTTNTMMAPNADQSGNRDNCLKMNGMMEQYGKSNDWESYNRMKKSFSAQCGTPPVAGQQSVCDQLRIDAETSSKAQDWSKVEEIKKNFADQCLPKLPDQDNPCARFKATVTGTMTAEQQAAYGKLCSAGQPVVPQSDFCVSMRTNLERGGDYTPGDKELYYKTCFAGNAYKSEDSACKDLRAKLVVMINANQTTTQDYTDLKAKFSSACPGQDVIPPAGFMDSVLPSYDSVTNPFPDTNPKAGDKKQSEEGQAATELYRRGVIGGFPDGEFKGDKPVNRAEAAKFLVLACNLSTDVAGPTVAFSDVDPNAWYAPFVKSASANGVINGYTDEKGNFTGKFGPEDQVTRAQFLKMLSMACKLPTDLSHVNLSDVPANAWFAKFAGVDQYIGLYDHNGDLLEPNLPLTRSDVARALFRFLKHSKRTSVKDSHDRAANADAATTAADSANACFTTDDSGKLVPVSDSATCAASDTTVNQ